MPPNPTMVTRCVPSRSTTRPADTPVSCLDLFAHFDRKAKTVKGLLERAVGDALPALLRVMGANDLGVFASSTVTPLEMSAQAPADLLDGVARAVGAGARLLYLRPAEECLTAFRERFDSALPYGPEVDEELARLRTAVRNRLPADPTKAETHIVQVRCPADDQEFFMPGFRVGMVQSFSRLPAPSVRMLVWLPANFGGAIYLSHNPADHFVDRFARFAHANLRRGTALMSAEEKQDADKYRLLLEVKRADPAQ